MIEVHSCILEILIPKFSIGYYHFQNLCSFYNVKYVTDVMIMLHAGAFVATQTATADECCSPGCRTLPSSIIMTHTSYCHTDGEMNDSVELNTLNTKMAQLSSPQLVGLNL